MAEIRDWSAAGHDDPAAGGGLIDLSGAPLHELLGREEDTVLAHALQRVITEASRQPGCAVTAFESAIL
jgi:FXSXX-COOH protein